MGRAGRNETVQRDWIINRGHPKRRAHKKADKNLQGCVIVPCSKLYFETTPFSSSFVWNSPQFCVFFIIYITVFLLTKFRLLLLLLYTTTTTTIYNGCPNKTDL
ncbi:hypothetical protein LSAT2_032292 [Lamellibrachia satsuma]|nr:hypothetical protein LSAT2_032292 [Lamellibrachia satsuma]